MSTLDFLSSNIYEQRHEELIKMAAESRLLKEIRKPKGALHPRLSRFMAIIGKELSSVGFSLELRYSGQIEPQGALSGQGNPSDCR